MVDDNKTAPAKNESLKTKLHIVLGRILHDGKFLSKGSKVQLTPAQAKQLGNAVIPVVDEEKK